MQGSSPDFGTRNFRKRTQSWNSGKPRCRSWRSLEIFFVRVLQICRAYGAGEGKGTVAVGLTGFVNSWITEHFHVAVPLRQPPTHPAVPPQPSPPRDF